MANLHTDHGWPGRAEVSFLAGTEEHADGAGLLGLVGLDAPRTIVFHVQHGDFYAKFASISANAQTVRFTLKYNQGGYMLVTIGGISQSMPVPAAAIRRISLSCSASQVVFSNVSVQAGK